MKKLPLISLFLWLAASPVTANGSIVTCEQVRELVRTSGSMAAAEQLALVMGYTRRQINWAKHHRLKV